MNHVTKAAKLIPSSCQIHVCPFVPNRFRFLAYWVLASACCAGPASSTAVAALVKAFPTAEGFGAEAVGGRGGRVIEVTNLEDAGKGSLRAAMEDSGPRICVFRVSGTITLKNAIQVRTPYLRLRVTLLRAVLRLKVVASLRAIGAFGLSTGPMILSFATCACGWAVT
jgi:hypothetical protein